MKSMRDYINLVEAAMQESKNKQSYEHHRDMAKLDTGPGRKDIHNALANKYGKRMDDEKKTQKQQGVAEGLESEDPKAKTLGKFAYYAITAKGKDEPQNPYPAGTQSAADFDEGYEAAYDDQTRNLLAAPVENLVRFYNVKDRLHLLKQGVAEEQLEETSPEAIAKIDQITRK